MSRPGGGHPSRRGDLVIVQQHHCYRSAGGGAREYDSFSVGAVTDVTRGGQVKMIRPAGVVDRNQPLPAAGLIRAHVHGAEEIDVPGALATAACRTWDDVTQVRPYDTLDQVRAALSPHLKTQPGWQALSRAALARAAAVTAAWDDWQCWHDTRGWNLARHRACAARITAANHAYQAVYVQVTAGPPAVPGLPAPRPAGPGAAARDSRPLELHEEAIIEAAAALGLPQPDITDPGQRAAWRQAYSPILARGRQASYDYARTLAPLTWRSPDPGRGLGRSAGRELEPLQATPRSRRLLSTSVAMPQNGLPRYAAWLAGIGVMTSSRLSWSALTAYPPASIAAA